MNSLEEITFVENKIKNTRRVFEEVGCHAFFDEDLCKAIEHILSDYKRVLKENEELKSKLENKDKYFELIIGLGYDYDGYYNRETSNGNIKGLADLMDELVQAARDGLNDIPYQKWKG